MPLEQDFQALFLGQFVLKTLQDFATFSPGDFPPRVTVNDDSVPSDDEGISKSNLASCADGGQLRGSNTETVVEVTRVCMEFVYSADHQLRSESHMHSGEISA